MENREFIIEDREQDRCLEINVNPFNGGGLYIEVSEFEFNWVVKSIVLTKEQKEQLKEFLNAN